MPMSLLLVNSYISLPVIVNISQVISERVASFQVSKFPSFRKPENQQKPAETRNIIFLFADGEKSM
jgi:hypothetical protein